MNISNLAVITARGGSKRIPRKNIKEFFGRPMLSYAVTAAKEAGIFDEIAVSTDDEEIAGVALNLGAKVPFMRSAKTSDDFATTADVLSEVLGEYAKLGVKPDTLCCIYPCVPFLTGEILKEAYRKFVSSGADSLVPVVKFSFPIQRAFRIEKSGFLTYDQPQNASKRSQDLEPMYHDVGMFYFYKTNADASPKVIPFIMDEKAVQDIDTPEDWATAEMKYKILQAQNR